MALVVIGSECEKAQEPVRPAKAGPVKIPKKRFLENEPVRREEPRTTEAIRGYEEALKKGDTDRLPGFFDEETLDVAAFRDRMAAKYSRWGEALREAVTVVRIEHEILGSSPAWYQVRHRVYMRFEGRAELVPVEASMFRAPDDHGRLRLRQDRLIEALLQWVAARRE